MKDYNKLAEEIITEPEFRVGGFVYKHVQEAKSDALVRMSELYNLERDDIGIVSELILVKFRNK